jgi:hypothetical protein
MFEPPINSVQIQTQFATRIFNSKFVWNLNLLPKGTLFLMLQYIIVQSLVNCGDQKAGFCNLEIQLSLKYWKINCI